QLVSQVSLLILLFFESLREFVLHFEQDPQLINGHNLLVVELLYSHRILQLFLPHLLTFVILFQRLPLDCMLFRLISLHDTSLIMIRSEEHTSELQSRFELVCRLLLEKKKRNMKTYGKHSEEYSRLTER